MVHVRDVMGKLIGRQARALQRTFEIRALKTRSQESQPCRQAAHHVCIVGGPVRGASRCRNLSHVVRSHGFLLLRRVRPLAYERFDLGHDERIDGRLREQQFLFLGRRARRTQITRSSRRWRQGECMSRRTAPAPHRRREGRRTAPPPHRRREGVSNAGGSAPKPPLQQLGAHVRHLCAQELSRNRSRRLN